VGFVTALTFFSPEEVYNSLSRVQRMYFEPEQSYGYRWGSGTPEVVVMA